MKFLGFVNAGTKPDGDVAIAATTGEVIPTAQIVTISQSDAEFVTGSIVNKSDITVQVQIWGNGSNFMHKHVLRPYESLYIRNLPIWRIGFISDSEGEVHVMLVKHLCETPSDFALTLSNMKMEDQIDAPTPIPVQVIT